MSEVKDPPWAGLPDHMQPTAKKYYKLGLKAAQESEAILFLQSQRYVILKIISNINTSQDVGLHTIKGMLQAWLDITVYNVQFSGTKLSIRTGTMEQAKLLVSFFGVGTAEERAGSYHYSEKLYWAIIPLMEIDLYA